MVTRCHQHDSEAVILDFSGYVKSVVWIPEAQAQLSAQPPAPQEHSHLQKEQNKTRRLTTAIYFTAKNVFCFIVFGKESRGTFLVIRLRLNVVWCECVCNDLRPCCTFVLLNHNGVVTHPLFSDECFEVLQHCGSDRHGSTWRKAESTKWSRCKWKLEIRMSSDSTQSHNTKIFYST